MAIAPNPQHRGDPLFLRDVLTLFGVRAVEFEAARDRGHGDFGRIIGVVAHHTGSNGTPASYIARHPQLGLCSQIHLARDGLATIVGVGIAYHAGRGHWPGWPRDNANAVSIGIEAQSDGTSPWPEEQLDAYYRTCAAICWYLGLSADAVIGHKEWAGADQGKWDPGGIHMPTFRFKIQQYIDHPPFMQEIKKKMTEQFDSIGTRYTSRVPGSTVTMRPIDALLNADAHSFVARANTEALLKRVAEQEQALRELGARLSALCNHLNLKEN
ncbi:peptidoglycan recognition protein family protein [Corynebacterium sp. TAE3-ERU16]|uniref:peptidoglycan recognition protein family protein n=1 Tax=Corynebacterium sp. TAE3-ERU16 TaxID=2849493 RepID=UPI002102A883|nr:N-acetylmuramoyl-L-alanine amidase [Corynebacterium sp. TAE3-ERU16]